MIQKNELDKIMNALMIRHWGIFLIDESYKNATRHFNVENSIFDYDDMKLATVIVIAMPYKLKQDEIRPAWHYGKIEPFAWGFDYHIEVKSRLMALVQALKNVTNENFEDVLYCVDDSPFNDREVAFHAGLGRIGMNHLLINDALGSQCFIGYIVIPRHLSMDDHCIVHQRDLPKELLHPFCKSCYRCVKACPTFVCGDNKSNMLHCLSSLTQTKKDIEYEFRSIMGHTIYGCSICQSVCPLNKSDISDLIHEPKQSNWIDLYDLLEMNQRSFKETYGHMGFAWRSLWIYKRNALIVLGNTGNKSVLDQLKRLHSIQDDSKLADYYKWAINNLKASIFEESDII